MFTNLCNNPAITIIELVSSTTYVVCVNFIYKRWELQFKVDFERQIFEKRFIAILFTLLVFARSLLRGNGRRNTFCILFWYLAWATNDCFISYYFTYPPRWKWISVFFACKIYFVLQYLSEFQCCLSVNRFITFNGDYKINFVAELNDLSVARFKMIICSYLKR